MGSTRGRLGVDLKSIWNRCVSTWGRLGIAFGPTVREALQPTKPRKPQAHGRSAIDLTINHWLARALSHARDMPRNIGRPVRARARRVWRGQMRYCLFDAFRGTGRERRTQKKTSRLTGWFASNQFVSNQDSPKKHPRKQAPEPSKSHNNILKPRAKVLRTPSLYNNSLGRYKAHKRSKNGQRTQLPKHARHDWDTNSNNTTNLRSCLEDPNAHICCRPNQRHRVTSLIITHVHTTKKGDMLT